MIVGIDVAKATVVAVVIDRSTRIRGSFTVKNTRKELKDFVLQIQKKYKKVIFASESTAEYHLELVRICLAQDISFRLLNPITTKQFTRATVRKKKTDLTDAHIIEPVAKLLLHR
jgi:transposase